MSWTPSAAQAIGWTGHWTLLLCVLAGLSAAGCIDPPAEDETGEKGEAPVETTNETTVPDPVVINGTARIGNPAHPFICVMEGVDGEYHPIGQKVDDWRYHLDPEDLAVYWYDKEEEYLEGGDNNGTVPVDAAFAEVCMTTGTEPVEYTLTIVHPDHEAA